MPVAESKAAIRKSETARRKGLVPLADLDLRDVAMRVAASWKSSELKLAWITSEQFEQDAVDYAVLMDERLALGAGRKPITEELSQLDKQINTHIANVKHYLADAYPRVKALSFYPEFGIVRVGKTYQLPIDRNERANALERLVVALTKHNLQNQRYGQAYWKDVAARYQHLMNQAGNTDSKVSAHVRDKNQLKTQIKKVLQSLILLVQANYPDNWRNVLRQWGFQKEKY
jgi:hypothetical protein